MEAEIKRYAPPPPAQDMLLLKGRRREQEIGREGTEDIGDQRYGEFGWAIFRTERRGKVKEGREDTLKIGRRPGDSARPPRTPARRGRPGRGLASSRRERRSNFCEGGHVCTW